LRRDALSREARVGDHLPYGRHVDANTIATRDGMLFQVLALRGLLFETADSEEIDYRKQLRMSLLQAIGSSRFALYHHVLRGRVEAELAEPAQSDDFSRRLRETWRQRLGGKRLYANEHFLTLLRRPARGATGVLDGLGSVFGLSTQRATPVASGVRALDTAREAVVAALGAYDPRLLTIVESDLGLCSEPLAFLSRLANNDDQPMRLPQQDLGQHLPKRRISFGRETVELGASGRTPREFVGVVSIKDYPVQTTAGMLDEALRLPFEIVVTQSFGFVERQTAVGRMNLALRRMRSSEDEAVSLREELSLAKDDVASGRVLFGEHHMTIAVRGQLRSLHRERECKLARLWQHRKWRDLRWRPTIFGRRRWGFRVNCSHSHSKHMHSQSGAARYRCGPGWSSIFGPGKHCHSKCYLHQSGFRCLSRR
jgi:type IV secretion system protein VirB4